MSFFFGLDGNQLAHSLGEWSLFSILKLTPFVAALQCTAGIVLIRRYSGSGRLGTYSCGLQAVSYTMFYWLLWKHESGVAALFHSSDLSQTTQVWQLSHSSSWRVVQSKTQCHSNVLKLLKLLQKSSQASKTFFQLLQIKRLQLKLTNNLQNSYQISSQHQVPKTWVKQHPKTPKTTKTNENPSPSSSMHKLVPFGSKLVPTWFL